MKSLFVSVALVGLVVAPAFGEDAQPANPAPAEIPVTQTVHVTTEQLNLLSDVRLSHDLDEKALKQRIGRYKAALDDVTFSEALRPLFKARQKQDEDELAARAPKTAAPAAKPVVTEKPDEEPVPTPKQEEKLKKAASAQPIPEPIGTAQQVTAAPVKPIEKAKSAVPSVTPKVLPALSDERLQALKPETVSDAAIAKAKALAAEAADPKSYSTADAQKRLAEMRGLIQVRQLPEDVLQALVARYGSERDALRAKLAKPVAHQPLPALSKEAADKLPDVPPAAPEAAAGLTSEGPLADKRPALELGAGELQQRLLAFDASQADDKYDPALREWWRQNLAYTRAVLRARLRQERKVRGDAKATLPTVSAKELPASIYAAEVDTVDILAALSKTLPKRDKKFTIRDFATDNDLRAASTRIEVDQIHFGYNEGFMREEDLGAIDATARAIEAFIRKDPKAHFLIEGNSDARGEEDYVLALSRFRAESVKRMLVAYYNIPEDNLHTVGLGAQFPLVPLAEPQPENNRISIVRLTLPPAKSN